MAAVLGIGNATLDIIHVVDRYPGENAEIRCRKRCTRRGGNATNTLVVLSQLGIECSWAGVLVDNADGHFVRDDLARHGIGTAGCSIVAQGAMPVSSILLSTQTGSRTIIHYRDLPEFTYADFLNIDLRPWDWLHFEGRNVGETRRMLEYARRTRPDTPCSVEIEKPRAGIEELFAHADVLLFSSVYARERGYRDPAALLQSVHAGGAPADLYCTRGAAGAVAVDRSGGACRHPAIRPPRVVDTLGAGDTFNAGVISGCLAGLEVDAVLARACELAGRKCGQHGLDGLGEHREPA
ncbi:MAG: PfkB family carbohydrate kinase [Gammaproteobacteria bacterium]|jgi:ketohexokinase